MNWPVQFIAWIKKAWKFTSTNTTSVRAAWAWRQIDLRVGMKIIIIITYLLHGAESFLSNWFAAGQEIPRILWNPKVHYRTHKRPPPVPVLGQPNPVHIPTSHLVEIHPNIIHPSTPGSPQLVSFLPVSPPRPYTPPSPHPYAPRAQPISFFSIFHPHNIGWGIEIN